MLILVKGGGLCPANGITHHADYPVNTTTEERLYVAQVEEASIKRFA